MEPNQYSKEIGECLLPIKPSLHLAGQ